MGVWCDIEFKEKSKVSYRPKRHNFYKRNLQVNEYFINIEKGFLVQILGTKENIKTGEMFVIFKNLSFNKIKEQNAKVFLKYFKHRKRVYSIEKLTKKIEEKEKLLEQKQSEKQDLESKKSYIALAIEKLNKKFSFLYKSA